jgi:hypothetical protein
MTACYNRRMTLRVGRRLPALLLAAALIPAKQIQAQLTVAPPEIEAFPRITLHAALTDGSGRPIADLPPDVFQVLEDGDPVETLQVEKVLVGTRQVFVINSSPGLGVRDSHGRTRYEFAQDELIRYWRDPEASLLGIDDLSLLTAQGVLIQHSESAAELAAVLDALAPSFEGGTSGYDLILQALDYSSDPAEVGLLPGSLIFLTPLIETPRDLPLANTIARAVESGTAIFPVLFATQETVEAPEVAPLRQLAEATGGELSYYDPGRGLQELASRFLAQRYQYRLTFESRTNAPGNHSLQVRVVADGLEAASLPQSYTIDVRPAELAFIQPPTEVLRQTDDPELPIEAIEPRSLQLDILVNFADGHPRPIRQSRLLVDDEVVRIRNSPPFERLEWDLTGYRASGQHTVQAVVVDSLGIQSETIGLPIQITIESPARGLAAFRPAVDSLVAVAALIVAATVMIGGLTTVLRRSPQPGESSLARSAPIKRARLQDRSPSEALLVPVRPAGEPLPLTGVDVVMGRDASLAAIVVSDPSVERMHARLIRQADGDYLLRDQGSVAGTWVNYDLVPSEGRRLRNGDLVQLGRVEFRFQLTGKVPPRTVLVYPDPQGRAAGR